MGSECVLEYNALFYKRSTNKSQKSKGSYDGILSINIVEQSLSLACADNDEYTGSDDDDDEENGKITWKERRKRMSKAGPRGVVFSGKLQGDLTASNIQEDATIVLGNYDVEILSLRSKPTMEDADKERSSVPPVRRGLVGSVVGKKTTTGVPVSKQPALVSRKTTGQYSVLNTRETLPAKRKQIAQPTKRPPAQPRKSLPPTCKVSAHSASRNRPPLQPRSVHSGTTVAGASAVLPHIPLLGNIRKVLRPHQETGVDFLWTALTRDKGAILADEMGLGKSLMSIAVVSAWHRNKREQSHVVVCPSSLVRNWEAEFDKWLGKASRPKRVVVRAGGEEGLQKIRTFARNQHQSRSHRVGQVLIVSYDLFRMHTRLIQQAMGGSIGLLLVDEGHRLKNTTGSQTMTALESLQTNGRLLITASPVQNNLSEFYSLVEFVRPGLLGSLSSFRKDFERPISAANRKNATPADRALADRQSRALETLMQSTILRRLQSEVLASMLPARTEILLFCKLSDEQRRLYQALTMNRLTHLSGPGPLSDALEILTELRKLCTHPSLLKTKVAGQLATRDLSSSGKLAVLSLLLQEIRTAEDDSKVVIVSNFTSALSLIEEMILKPNDLSYLRLDGTVNATKRQALVDTFNRTSAANSFCFLLSAKAGGCGLNLVGANKLVMFDPDWNPATDLQAMGRIYRTGQTRATTIYRMFSTGTVEEIIYQRQQQKGALASVTVDCREDGKASFSPEELKECMALKTMTHSDTKDKMGWPDFANAVEATDGNIDEATEQVLESDMLTYVRVVDEKTSQKRSNAPVVTLSTGRVNTAPETYASDTSEEEFVESDVKRRRGVAARMTVGGSLEREDEAMEFD